MNSKKQFAFQLPAFFTVVLILIFCFSQTANLVFAQEDEYITAPTSSSGASSDEVNIYLDNSTQSAPTNNTAKSPAQVANGKLSGQYDSGKLSCPYAFERDLYIGVKGEDVRLLQTILNTDKRTVIATSGQASPGQETTLFGPATKEAVKKFQALFIEYIGVANGRLGPRTRTVVNAICNGKTPANSGNSYQNVQNIQNNQPQNTNQNTTTGGGENTNATSSAPRDTTPLRVSLSANLNAVQRGDYFKVIINTSKPIQKFTPESVIVDGGVVREIRKLGPTAFTMTITPNDDARQVVAQIEAEKLQDIFGIVNVNASNEILVRVLVPVVPKTNAQATSTTDLSAILDKIISSAPNCTYNNTGLLITGPNLNTTGCAAQQSQSIQFYTCYGQQIPTTQQCPYDANKAAQQAQQNGIGGGQGGGQGGGMGGGLGSGGGMGGGMGGLGEMLGKLLKNSNFGGGGNGSGGGSGTGDKSATPEKTKEPDGPVNNPNAPQPPTRPPGVECIGITDPTEKANCQNKTNNSTDPCKSSPESQECQQKLISDSDPCKSSPESQECQQKLINDAGGNKKENKDLDIVQKVMSQCSSKANFFCIKYPDEILPYSSADLNFFSVKYKDSIYLLLAKKEKVDLKEGYCILQQPEIKENKPKYNVSGIFVGCVAKKTDCKETGNSVPTPPLKIGAAAKYWYSKDPKDPVLKGQTCTEVSSK